MENEANLPEIVYKFRTWTDEFHINTLKSNEVFMASPSQFNDPFDCQIKTNYNLLDNPEKKERFARQLVTKQYANVLAKGLNPETMVQMMIERLEDMETFQQEADENLTYMQNNFFGILSLAENWDNILMWSHYSEHHKGICIGFHEKKLRESLLFGKGGRVLYGDYPQIYPEHTPGLDIGKFITQTHHKSPHWGYENEYRLSTTFSPDGSVQRVVKIPDDCFAEIIVGVKFPQEKIKEILDEADKKSIPVYQARMVRFAFEIDRIRIN